MKAINRTGVRSAAALAIAGGVIAMSAGSALAATSPVADPHSINDNTAGVGGITLLNATGGSVTSGSASVPFNTIVARITATGLAPAGYRGDDPNADSDSYVAGGSVFTPVAGSDPYGWSGTSFGATTPQPTPATSNPTAVVTTTQSLDSLIATGGGTSTGTYANYYEVRLRSYNDDTGAAPIYYTLDLLVNPTADTFTVVDPVPAAVVTPPASLPEAPYALLIPLVGMAALGGTVIVRRRARDINV